MAHDPRIKAVAREDVRMTFAEKGEKREFDDMSRVAQRFWIDRATRLVEAIDRARPVNVQMVEYEQIMWLAARDIVFFGTDDGGPFLLPTGGGEGCRAYVLISDTFGYALADAEDLLPGDAAVLIECYKRWDHDGVTAWAAVRRECEPIKPHRTARYYEARTAIENGDVIGTGRKAGRATQEASE